jgi:beta-phosphoglucomutase-like phosphatase (HAD superfamily)
MVFSMDIYSETSTWHYPSDREAVLNAAAGACVVWDFDGVIADNEPLQAESFRILLTSRGHIPEPGFFTPMMGHTEPRIWEMLAETGAPAGDIPATIVERRNLYRQLAMESLEPSWLAAEMMPAIARVATRQVVLSNGDFETNGALLKLWGLDRYVEQIQKPSGQSKAALLPSLLEGRSISVEDNAGYLNTARDLGAFCVGVLHSQSRAEPMRAHVTVNL